MNGFNRARWLLSLMSAGTAGLTLFGNVTTAQVINFDVPGGMEGVNYSGAGAAPDSGAYWNPVTYQGTTSGGGCQMERRPARLR
jgi:hypothetical protein